MPPASETDRDEEHDECKPCEQRERCTGSERERRAHADCPKPGRPLRPRRQGHLHPRRHSRHHRQEDGTAEASGDEVDANPQESPDTEGNQPDAGEAPGGEAITLTFATSATPPGAAPAALAPCARGRPRRHPATSLRRREVVALELHDEAQFALAEEPLDRAHDPGPAAYIMPSTRQRRIHPLARLRRHDGAHSRRARRLSRSLLARQSRQTMQMIASAP